MRAPLTLALEALRLERRLVLFVLAAVCLTAALVFPTEALPRVGLALAPIPSAAGAMPLTLAASGPSDAQQRALAELLELLRALGWSALAVAGFTLLSLYTTSSARRSHELGVHRAVGASRRDIVATLLLEALAVAVAALLLGALAGRALLALGLADWPGLVTGRRAWPVGAGAALLATVLAGRLLPIHVARRRDVPLEGPREVALGVPMVQFGVSLAMLLAGFALFEAAGRRPGTAATPDAGGVLVDIDASALDVPSRARLFGALLTTAREQGAELPSVASAGQAIGLGTVDFVTTHCGMCYRGGVFLEYEPTHAVHHLVSPDSFAAHRIPVLTGRVFTAADTLGATRVVVINRQMALRHFEPGDPVGRALYLSDGFPGTPYTVVGVVDDGSPDSFGAAHQRGERVYLSALQHPPVRAQLLLRSRGGERPRLLESITGLVANSGARTGAVQDERDARAAAVAPTRWLGRWALAGGLVLMLLSGLGLATTVRLWVASLQAELGLRRAVGATRGAILRHVAWRALLASGAGLVVAVALLFTAVKPIVETSLGGLPLWRPGLFLVAGAMLLVIALTSALAPATRIARTAPARLFE